MKYFSALVLCLLVFLPTHALRALEAGSIISLINAERSARGLSSLQEHEKLNKAAQSKAQAIALSGRLQHTTSSDGELWWPLEDVGYRYTLIGENLGVNIETPSLLISEWMSSPSHRANIMNPQFEDIGVATARGYFLGEKADYIVLYTAKPRNLVTSAAVVEAVAKDTLKQSKEEMENMITKLLLLINELINKADAEA